MKDFIEDSYYEIHPKHQKKSYVKNKKEEVFEITDEITSSLIRKKIDHRDIQGYISNKNYTVKYDKNSGLRVVYDNNKLIDAKIVSCRDYTSEMFGSDDKLSYKDEIN